MKKTAYLFSLIITFAIIINSCKKDSDLYFKYRPTNENNMITKHGAELYSFSIQDSIVKLASYYARVHGKIETYGDTVIKYGHCWGLSENPILVSEETMTVNEAEGFNTSGTTIVEYESRLSNLTKESNYYVRSYIITADGAGNIKDTAYNVNNLNLNTPPPTNEWLETTGGGKPSARYDAVAFNKGDTVYFGTGNQKYIDAPTAYLANDFWQYDPKEDAWTQISAVPQEGSAEGLTQAIGFALTFYRADIQKTVTRLYIALGDYVGDNSYLHKSSRVYEYNMETNIWKIVEPFASQARSEAVVFAMGDKAFVGTGTFSAPRNDWMLYDPVTQYDPNDNRNPWRGIATPGGSAIKGRTGAIAFSVNNRGYFGLGRDSDGNFLSDFYEFDPNTETWGKMKDFPGEPRANAVGFKIDDQGFVGTGDNITAYDTQGNATAGDAMSDFYRYDPFNNVWTERADYTIWQQNTTPKKVTRAVGFYSTSEYHEDLGYIGFGYINNTTKHTQQDVWYYRP